jgi:hypothetical protein
VAVEQLVDALQREMAATARPRKRLTLPPIKLAADAPLRKLTPDAIKRLDKEAVQQSDVSK